MIRELDEALGLSRLSVASLSETRKGRNCTHLMSGQFGQSLFGRVARYEDVNDAERLSRDPVMRQIVGRAENGEQGDSTSQMNRFETQVLSTADNRAVLVGLSGRWIDRFSNDPQRHCLPLHWTWIVRSAPPMAIKKELSGMGTSSAIILYSCSIN